MKVIILLLSVAIVASKSVQKPSSAKDGKNDKDLVMQNLKKLKELLSEKTKSTQTNSIEEDQAKATKEEPAKEDRKAKSLNYYSYFPPPVMHLNYPSNLGYLTQNKDFRPIIPADEWLSRTEPFKRKTNHLVDSPTYYIRLPPNPYVFVPGMGYVSRPPTMADPELLNTIPSNSDKGNEISPNQFYHLPLNFVSNGKPTSVFQLPNEHVRPKPDASIYSLNKGPYFFNGKPTDIYLLRNSLNSLYADALTNFYP